MSGLSRLTAEELAEAAFHSAGKLWGNDERVEARALLRECATRLRQAEKAGWVMVPREPT